MTGINLSNNEQPDSANSSFKDLSSPVSRAIKHNGPYQVELINTELARVYLIYPKNATPTNWSYGGLRALPPNFGLKETDAAMFQSQRVTPHEYAVCFNRQEQAILTELRQLGIFESGVKHSLINYALKQGLIQRVRDSINSAVELDGMERLMLIDHLDQQFAKVLDNTVYGGRGVFVPHNLEAAQAISEAAQNRDKETLAKVFRPLADRLNELNGLLKLTPDFGRNAYIAEAMSDWTAHVLGVPFDRGGASGKSAYTAAGILRAIELFKTRGVDSRTPITIIGSEGALGKAILTDIQRSFSDIAVSDVMLNDPSRRTSAPEDCLVIDAEPDNISIEALKRGGLLITATVRNELENSDTRNIPNNTVILLAQNHSIKFNAAGLELLQKLAKRNITVVPGQILTLAGALTARLEWAWRSANGIVAAQQPVEDEILYFPKRIAHYFSSQIVEMLMEDLVFTNDQKYKTPYERMRNLVGLMARSDNPRPWK